MEKKYEVAGLHCMGCVNILKGEISEVSGVSEASVSEDFKTLKVVGDSIDDEKIKSAVIDAGYEYIKAI